MRLSLCTGEGQESKAWHSGGVTLKCTALRPTPGSPSQPYDATPSWPCMAPSAQRPHPAGDGPPDLVRRIFLEEMDPRDRHLGLRWPPADEVEIRAAGEARTGLALHEQLGHTARRQPVHVGGHDRRHVGGLALDGDLPAPRHRPPAPPAGPR